MSSVKWKAKTPQMIIESESEELGEQVDQKQERQDELKGFKDQLVGAIAMMQVMKLWVEKIIRDTPGDHTYFLGKNRFRNTSCVSNMFFLKKNENFLSWKNIIKMKHFIPIFIFFHVRKTDCVDECTLSDSMSTHSVT